MVEIIVENDNFEFEIVLGRPFWKNVRGMEDHYEGTFIMGRFQERVPTIGIGNYRRQIKALIRTNLEEEVRVEEKVTLHEATFGGGEEFIRLLV